jgi:hypothetical protein
MGCRARLLSARRWWRRLERLTACGFFLLGVSRAVTMEAAVIIIVAMFLILIRLLLLLPLFTLLFILLLLLLLLKSREGNTRADT